MEVVGADQKETRVWILTDVSYTSITERKERHNDERKLAEKSRVRVKVIK
jgi:hypothetical protein